MPNRTGGLLLAKTQTADSTAGAARRRALGYPRNVGRASAAWSVHRGLASVPVLSTLSDPRAVVSFRAMSSPSGRWM